MAAEGSSGPLGTARDGSGPLGTARDRWGCSGPTGLARHVTTTPSKIGYPAQNFARAAFGGAKSSLWRQIVWICYGDDMFCRCSGSNFQPFSGPTEAFFCQKRKNWDSRGLQVAFFLPKKGIWGSRRPSGGLLLFTNSNVVQVLLSVATVVLLLLLTITTVLRSQR